MLVVIVAEGVGRGAEVVGTPVEVAVKGTAVELWGIDVGEEVLV